ncbi:hypothetical protein N7492_005654 [Penicillium capsulatum]|uniref:Uncharacterized protein n=1 Tax=Penicillium capsulatum TaxID=69766 RepID=A0A9W9IA79_9EURO|nr:hypothetical protein N7492_005654 [Penicillium capsulatum]KAJ6135249.1 hypothetical protein N7512_000409 [Penicillium capsulatum]
MVGPVKEYRHAEKEVSQCRKSREKKMKELDASPVRNSDLRLNSTGESNQSYHTIHKVLDGSGASTTSSKGFTTLPSKWRNGLNSMQAVLELECALGDVAIGGWTAQ